MVLGQTILFVASFLFLLKLMWKCVGFDDSMKDLDQLLRPKFLICEPL